MGVLADLLANASSIDTSVPREGGNRVSVRQINDHIARIGDPDTYPAGTGTAANEVQSIAIFSGTVNGGTFTLTITLQDGTSFTTAGINHNAVAATIEGAIDTAALTKVQGFVASDISVAGGPLTTTPVTLTFDGASVAGRNHGLTTAGSGSLTGGGSVGAITQTTAGQAARRALASLIVLGILSGTLPAQGVNTGFTVQNARGKFPNNMSEETVRDLIKEATVEEKNEGLEAALLTALGY